MPTTKIVPRTPVFLALAAAAAALAFAPAARADDLPPFGARGHVVFDDLIGFRFGEPGYLGQLRTVSQNYIAPPPTVGEGGLFGYEHDDEAFAANPPAVSRVKTDSFWIAPEVDWFVANRISIGAAAGILLAQSAYSGPETTKGYRTATLGITFVPRVGYVVPINDRLALWPRASIGYTRTAANQIAPTPVITGASVVSTWSGGLELGLVFRMTRNLFIHATPAIVASDSYAVSAGGEFKNFAVGASGAASVAVIL